MRLIYNCGSDWEMCLLSNESVHSRKFGRAPIGRLGDMNIGCISTIVNANHQSRQGERGAHTHTHTPDVIHHFVLICAFHLLCAKCGQAAHMHSDKTHVHTQTPITILSEVNHTSEPRARVQTIHKMRACRPPWGIVIILYTRDVSI